MKTGNKLLGIAAVAVITAAALAKYAPKLRSGSSGPDKAPDPSEGFSGSDIPDDVISPFDEEAGGAFDEETEAAYSDYHDIGLDPDKQGVETVTSADDAVGIIDDLPASEDDDEAPSETEIPEPAPEAADDQDINEEDNFEEAAPAKEEIVTVSYGSYPLPAGFVVSEKHSTPSKTFFVRAGEENAPLPDNISINKGINRFSADQHEQFSHAIAEKLASQIEGAEGVEISAGAEVTLEGDVVYIFEIKEDRSVTTQYYIVGENSYVLIHETNFTGSEDVDEAAKEMALGFSWAR